MAAYTYDAFGRRVSKIVNGTATYFIYDGDDVIADYSSDSLLREYIHGNNIDEILAMQSGSDTYYYHYDGLGSVTEITDGSGAVAENYTYDVYGAPSVTTSTINNRYRFTGREYDEESGLYHYRRRYYDPSLGRFMQRDPIGYYDSMNLFGYVKNSPNNLVDPMGLSWMFLIEAEDTMVADRIADEANPTGLATPFDWVKFKSTNTDRSGRKDLYRHYQVSRAMSKVLGSKITVQIGAYWEVFEVAYLDVP